MDSNIESNYILSLNPIQNYNFNNNFLNNINTPHSYENLVNFLYNHIPTHISEKQILSLPPVKISIQGNKKSLFVNFNTIVCKLDRTHEHLKEFILSELNASGSIDSKSQLLINGRYRANHIESIIKQYVKRYILCKNCKSYKTEMLKQGSKCMIICKNCQSSFPYDPISKGFVAITRKDRKKEREEKKNNGNNGNNNNNNNTNTNTTNNNNNQS
jgi:translation initiation factor 2 subunit 2